MRLGRYDLRILVDEVPLEEYETDINGNNATCWIASEEGKAFAVGFRQAHGSSRDTKLRIFLDGFRDPVQNSLFHRTLLDATVVGRSISASERVPFCFQVVTTTDEETLDNAASISDDFGSIQFKVSQGERAAAPSETQNFSTPAASSLASAFNELSIKEKKLSHVCSYGAPVKHSTVYWDWTPDNASPTFVFTFRYRSKSLLQAMGIIKPVAGSASPPQRVRKTVDDADISIITISSDGDDDDGKNDEAEKAAREVAELQAKLADAKERAAQYVKQKRAKKLAVKTEPEDIKPIIDVKPTAKQLAKGRGKVTKKVKEEEEESD